MKREYASGREILFAGNACKTLINKSVVLKDNCYPICLKYVNCFEDFRLAVESWLSQTLEPGYADNINQFRFSYLALGIKVTLKVHIEFAM